MCIYILIFLFMASRRSVLYIVKHLASIPFIYAPFFVMIPLDIVVEIYHRVGFKLYDLPYINRAIYIKFDREKLSYLSWFQKLNCLYCSYANGLMPYAAAICAATERYWCPLKHEDSGVFKAPEHHKRFANFGDKEAFEKLYDDPNVTL